MSLFAFYNTPIFTKNNSELKSRKTSILCSILINMSTAMTDMLLHNPLIVTSMIVMCVIIMLIAATYIWSLKDKSLQAVDIELFSYEQSMKAIHNDIAQETGKGNLQKNCGTRIYAHGEKTNRVVVMLHGYTACPAQFDALAKQFFNRNYNVYIPRSPHHGQQGDARNYSTLNARELVDYANDSINKATGLGEHIGVIGLSGGGVLATWLSQYRSDVVERALILSPFYRPSKHKIATWKVRPLTILYGYKLVKDKFSKNNFQGFSYYGLAQYLRIVENFDVRRTLPNLKRLAVVYSRNDTVIDHMHAVKIPKQMSKTNAGMSFEKYIIPEDWGVGHDIVMGNKPDINGREKELYKTYIDLYEKVS